MLFLLLLRGDSLPCTLDDDVPRFLQNAAAGGICTRALPLSTKRSQRNRPLIDRLLLSNVNGRTKRCSLWQQIKQLQQ